MTSKEPILWADEIIPNLDFARNANSEWAMLGFERVSLHHVSEVRLAIPARSDLLT